MSAALSMFELERDFQKLVIDAAHVLGWRVAHFRPAQTARGWRTAVQGDGAGFPDLVLAHEKHGVIFAELKRQKAKPTDKQAGWIGLLVAAGADVYVWRPDDFDRIVDILSGREPRGG